MTSFVHLRVHTEYSLVDGITRIKPLVAAVKSAQMPAIAVTDECNLFSMVKFYAAACQSGIKPIIGADVWVEDDASKNDFCRLTLLCMDRRGYLNLNQLVTRSYLEGQAHGKPAIKRKWFDAGTEGLIALSGGRRGDVGMLLLNDDMNGARDALAEWNRLFPDRYYMELHRTGRDSEEKYLHAAVELAASTSIPVVATNEVCFLEPEDYEAHEARVCIHEGRILNDDRRTRHYSGQQYLRTPHEMFELFADIPEALTNTVEIARRCNFGLELGKNYLPYFPVPADMSVTGYLRQQSESGLDKRLEKIITADTSDPDAVRKCYTERLDMELGVIDTMGFPGYFLIVADFIQWAKQHGIPVGPGRGSGAGSLVAYSLGITDLDPIQYELLFERFLNPERVSLPDFDVDFCMDRRDEVIEYVAERYGRDHVSQIITYGTMAARAVIRDVGRVLGMPYGFVDLLAKLIPFETGMTLDKALQDEEELAKRYKNEDEVRTLFDLAKKLEGIPRNAGKHAGGVVIAPSPLTEFTPLYCEQGVQTPVTQLDKDDIEEIGLVKFDFLGLRTLTIIDWAVKTINQCGDDDHPLDISDIPMSDPDAYDLLKRCETTAIFQLESRGMKELIKRLQPDCFEDVIALVALFRPGPLQSGMVEDFINRKHGRARVHYPHPALETILKPTYGVILYQEQVMQIARELSGYTLGSADLLRRAMGKKKPEEMAKQRSIFVDGATGNNVDAKTAEHIFDLIEKFAGYGFNKSHSAAYALLAYQTAWLKAHYPAEFMSAVLSADMDNTDKIVMLIDECRRMQLSILPPDINTCRHKFKTRDKKSIYYGLGAIKGVGLSAIEGLIETRENGGSFSDLFEFCRRIDHRKTNRRVTESLVRAGALDSIGPGRARIMASLPSAFRMAEQYIRDKESGQNDMFGTTQPEQVVRAEYAEAEDWDDDTRLLGEKETLGLYLTGHPINKYEEELAQVASMRLIELKPTRDQTLVVAGMVVALQTRNTRQGDRMAYITLDDRTARVEVAVFPEEYRQYRHILSKDRVLVIEGVVSVDEYTGAFRMRASTVYTIDEAREHYAKRLEIAVNTKTASNGFIKQLEHALSPFTEGKCMVSLNYRRTDAAAQLMLGDKWRVHPTDELLHRLRGLVGEKSVKVIY